jgi:hypothetical protein
MSNAGAAANEPRPLGRYKWKLLLWVAVTLLWIFAALFAHGKIHRAIEIHRAIDTSNWMPQATRLVRN